MLQTPSPPGAPAFAAPLPAARLPDGEPLALRPAARRGTAGWREIAWVGFADRDVDHADGAGAALLPPAPSAGPVPPLRSSGCIDMPVAVAAGIDLPGSRPDGEQPSHNPAKSRLGAGLTGRLSLGLRRVRVALQSLLRIAIAAVTMGAVTVFAYQGGEWLAGLVGPAAAVPVHPTTALAAPESEREALAPIADPAGNPAERAAYYLERARAADPAAQFNLAVLYASGSGVPQDYASAARWFRDAATAGNAAAQFDLAVMYERGLGVVQNLAEAVSWYGRAAQQDYPPAQYNLAIAHAEGHGTPQDGAAAARWYRAAARHGVAAAMVNLAILYEKGDGVDLSPADAYAWYRAAARAGDGEAERRARQLFQQFSGEGKAKAVMAASALTTVTGAAAAPAAKPPAATPSSDRSGKPLAAQPAG